MNIREGLRRLGIVLGITGMLAGVVVGYQIFAKVLEDRAKYKAFADLVHSPEVQGDLEILDGFEPISTEFTKEHPSKKGIHKVLYSKSKDGKHSVVSSFEMEDGAMLYRQDAPPLMAYVLPFTLPALGFAISWGLIRVLVWVGKGLRQRRDSPASHAMIPSLSN
jgi:hypothetical protein